MQLPFKCIVDVGTFREEVDSIVDKALFKEDRSVEEVGLAAKQDSRPSDWKNISVGTVIAQPIVQPSGSAVLLSEMLWDWSPVNYENKWFTEIIQKFDCEDQVSDARAMDGRSYCLTTIQRYNAAYDNFVRSMVKT